MAETMEYRGFVGSIEKDDSDGVFYGKLRGIRDLVNYEADTREGLLDSFKEAVDDYERDLVVLSNMAAEGSSDADVSHL